MSFSYVVNLLTCCWRGSPRIYITHLHGDHCFGLGAALALLDGAKARKQQDPARRRHHIYGPPGLAVRRGRGLAYAGSAG